MKEDKKVYPETCARYRKLVAYPPQSIIDKVKNRTSLTGESESSVIVAALREFFKNAR